MAVTNLKSLVGKLNATCRRALEGAAGLCMSRTNYNVEVEHWLLKLMEADNTDLTRIFRHYGVETARLNRDLTRALEKLRTGNARAPELSADITDLMREAWVVGSLEHGAYKVRSGFLLAALMTDRNLAARMQSASAELKKLEGEKLQKEVGVLIKGTAEDEAEAAPTPGAPSEPGKPPVDSKTPALDQYTLNLTERARKGEIDPVVGREFEIRQVIDILTRRRQNNPILTGEAGVGKTAVVEGFALKIVAGDVPPPLKNVIVRTLDLGLLQAGAGVKGEFENRLKSVIAEVKASPIPIILFIDEAHTIIGAGGQAGQGDAANLLKPALARGELRTVAATTWMEYKKYFETDAALKRRFQVVKVEEPDTEKSIRMMRGLTATLEKHHKVRLLDEAVADAVKLSQRYITDRQLPDKSVSLLDTACARVALSQASVPAAIEDCRREIEHLDIELQSVERESALGVNHELRLQEIKDKKKATEERLAGLEKRWAEEQKLVEQLHQVRGKLEAHVAAGHGGDAKAKLTADQEGYQRGELARLERELAAVQGEHPLVLPVVNTQAVAEVVSGWTGIPLGKMVRNEIEAVMALQDRLQERIIGQNHALHAIAQRIRTARANLLDPRKPIGVFLLVGPSGVGKTETAMALADILYGGDRNMTIINMSEYKEDHKISRLTGSAPGYVGYGEGGVLTEAVRRKPYSIVLLDEIEKANEAVQEIFYQVFDKGTLQDDKGQEVNFKNTIILLTSNVGTDTIAKLCADPETMPDDKGLQAALRPDLLKAFKPAFVGRLEVVPFFPLSDEVLQKIIKLKLKQIGNRIRENHRATFGYDDALVSAVASRCKEVESGARNVDNILGGTLLPGIAGEFLACMAEGKHVAKAHVSLDDKGNFVYEVA
jgi:type VI secretion system protein VasG